mgnify:CR=1 FL=1
MKKLLTYIFLFYSLLIIIPGCKKDENPTTPDSGSVIGKWRILTSNGIDVSNAGGTFDITETQITESWAAFSCTKVYSYTKSGNNYTTILQSTTCSIQGNDPSNVPGYKATGTFVVSGNKLTITLEKGTVVVCQRM